MKSEIVLCGGVILRGPLLDGNPKATTAEDLQKAVVLPEELLERVLSVRGGLSQARAWLNVPNPGLGGRSPLDAAVHQDIGAVYRILDSGGAGALESERPIRALSAPAEDSASISAVIRNRLLQLDSKFGQYGAKLPVSLILPKGLAQEIEVLRFRFKVPKPALFNAAACLCIGIFEQVYGKPIPLDPGLLTAMPPGAADRVRDWSESFQDAIRYGPRKTVNTSLGDDVDTKLANAVYLLHMAGCKIGKRILVGTAAATLLEQIVKAVGPITVPESGGASQ